MPGMLKTVFDEDRAAEQRRDVERPARSRSG